MSTYEQNASALVPAQSAALSRTGLKSLAARGRDLLRRKEEAAEWLRKGEDLQETAPEALAPELEMTLEYVKQILAGVEPDAAARNLRMTPENQEYAHVAHYFMPDALKECSRLKEVRESQLQEAFRCFERGIELDPHHPQLQHFIGCAYYLGLGVKQDYLRAYLWFHKAAKRGNSSAQYFLGIIFENGEGVAQDTAQAAAWLRKAAEAESERVATSHIAS